MSPRKVRLVIDLIRNQTVAEAEKRLAFTHKLATRPVLKLLKSAEANAEHNFKLNKETLWVKTVMADGGPTLKRSMPRAMGRATPIRERTTHITLVLSDEDRSAVKPAAPAAPVEPEAKKEKKPTEKKPRAVRKPKAAAKPSSANA